MSDAIRLIQDKVLLAPLAGISNLPFRLTARRFGCDLCFSEMVSANGLIRESAKTIEYLETSPADRPLGIQLFGADPAVMSEAAKFVAKHHPDVIDINMGCPVRKVVKTGSGAMLLKNPALAGRIVEAVVRAVRVPVTVKIRAGWSAGSINACEMARMAEGSGASGIIVHGRTADQGFAGHADWDIIARVKSAVHIPVVGNGDIWRPEDAQRMRRETGCDAVMVGRGALGNPWLFRGIGRLSRASSESVGPSLAERYETIKEHWALEAEIYGSGIAVRTFRKHLLWYTKGLPGSGRFRETVGKMTKGDDILHELDRYFQSLAGAQTEIMT
ncbi:MAG: tRNA dihydrouridine synthase DusB [Deltaproteobacteria bacterium]|nr:tRNA dihydrouridine synthase DusB [Deltaproteobacteria bacterium]